jgi:hypothetical protein
MVRDQSRAIAESGRYRARRIFPSLGSCERCGRPATDRHHKDADPTNNSAGNVAMLCRSCHMKADGRLDRLIANGRVFNRGRRGLPALRRS